MNIQPLFENVLIEQFEMKEKTDSGFLLPEQIRKERTGNGKISAIGKDVANVKVGDIILFDKYTPNEFNIETKNFLIIKEKDILAILYAETN